MAKHDSVAASEENDATEEAQDDNLERSVPGAAGSDHQPLSPYGLMSAIVFESSGQKVVVRNAKATQ